MRHGVSLSDLAKCCSSRAVSLASSGATGVASLGTSTSLRASRGRDAPFARISTRLEKHPPETRTL